MFNTDFKFLITCILALTVFASVSTATATYIDTETNSLLTFAIMLGGGLIFLALSYAKGKREDKKRKETVDAFLKDHEASLSA